MLDKCTDPVALGQNFATVMHLADYEDNVINGRIWTQPMQIEERLADLNEHMEKVIQMYLRNEYETIADYNAEAGNIAEKYHHDRSHGCRQNGDRPTTGQTG